MKDMHHAHTRHLRRRHARSRIETGKLAKQADGSVIVRSGDTMVLVTACRAANPREGIDFLPLTVDYREYTYASGRIPGGFFKREGKPAEKEVLTSRLIDRPIRPLFPAGWRYETQIIALVLSADTENDTDVLAITGASAALALSEHSVPEDDRRRARRPGRRRVRHQPDVRAAQAEHARPHRRRQQGRHRDGRGRREGSDRGAGGPGARSRARGDQGDRRRASTTLAKAGRQEEARRSRRRRSATTSTARSRRRCSCRSPRRCGSSDKLENYGTRRPGARRTCVAGIPEERGRAQAPTRRRSSRS